MIYTKDDLPNLHFELMQSKKAAEGVERINYNKLQYSNAPRRRATRIEKLIRLLEHDMTIEDYNSGFVLINNRFVVSLISNKWRVIGRNKWYMHKNDITHFVNNYILRDEK
jgi:hypothetical protein